jgi:hypothetical protein
MDDQKPKPKVERREGRIFDFNSSDPAQHRELAADLERALDIERLNF